MAGKLPEESWKTLIRQIKKGRCTPFVGAGASAGLVVEADDFAAQGGNAVPTADKMAESLANEYDYPFVDRWDLARVTQYIAVRHNERLLVKEEVVDRIAAVPPPDFDDPSQPHRLLADLRLPVYVTTNYDDFLAQAIRRSAAVAGTEVQPREEICDWGDDEAADPDERAVWSATSDRPVVYHLHGHQRDPGSMVLTEDDYLDFLVRAAGRRRLVPPEIRAAMSSPISLLFVGYSLQDWTFRVLFRSLIAEVPVPRQVAHISVQLPPESVPEERRDEVLEYLNRYFGAWKISVYWDDVRQFCHELRKRWEES
jgi:SIR2-like domain